MYHSTLGSRVIKQRRRRRQADPSANGDDHAGPFEPHFIELGGLIIYVVKKTRADQLGRDAAVELVGGREPPVLRRPRVRALRPPISVN